MKRENLVTLSAEFLCAMVSLGDPKFREADRQRVTPPAPTGKAKPPPRKPK